MQKITPFLWFNNNAEEAIGFYMSIFKNSKIIYASRHGKGGPAPEGALITATVEIEGQQLMVLNGGPMFSFTEAFSLFVSCKTQEEVDELWEKLSEGGAPSRCGWLKDKYGLSWQIIPTVLGELMNSKEPGKAQRVMQAMFQMNKLDIKGLQEA